MGTEALAAGGTVCEAQQRVSAGTPGGTSLCDSGLSSPPPVPHRAQALGSNALAVAKRLRVPVMILKPEAGRRIMIGASSKAPQQVQVKEDPDREEAEVTLAPRPNGGQPEKPVGVKTLLAYEVRGGPGALQKGGCAVVLIAAPSSARLQTGAVSNSMVRFVSMLLRPDMDTLILARATGSAPGSAPPPPGVSASSGPGNMQTSAEARSCSVSAAIVPARPGRTSPRPIC